MASSFLDDYQSLMQREREMSLLDSASSVLHWDMETKMPPRALRMRSEQIALIDIIWHKRRVDPEVERLVSALEDRNVQSRMDEVQRRNVHLVRKSYNESAKIPETLVAETAKHRVIAVGSWKKAKAAKDYSMFLPDLKRMVELRMQAALILQEVKGVRTPYDALIDIFEPGMNSETITGIFSEMRNGLMRILNKVESSGTVPDREIISRPVSIAAQRRISEEAMRFIGYDTTGPDAGGRLDETEHPFTVGTYDDVRITTHYYPTRYVSSLFSVLHEGGHALYDQHLPAEWMYQPIGSPSSFGIHESQSRFVENIVGRSPEFLSYVLPKLRRIARDAVKGVKKDQFVLAVNDIQPSKIRVEADEVTYGLHVIIRFEIERDLFAHKVEVKDLPQLWNEKYEHYLGVEIEHDSEGVMQDTHWAGGSFGYFPSYALGNIYGGMFLGKLQTDMPAWRAEVRKGNYSPVGNWLKENVHSHGNLYDPADLVKHVTGKRLEVEPFIRYLDEKLSSIYGF